jgi:hypothetical protein
MSATLDIESEAVTTAATALVVPSEDVGTGYDDGGADIDTGQEMAPVPRRPERQEWVQFLVAAMITCRLLVVRSADFRVNYYHVDKSIRRDVAEDLKLCRVVPYYSLLNRRVYLHISTWVEPGVSGWADSLAILWGKPQSWHDRHAVLVRSNRERARYDLRVKPIEQIPAWPTATTNELLGTALGTAGFITDPNHPAYQRLLEGEELV